MQYIPDGRGNRRDGADVENQFLEPNVKAFDRLSMLLGREKAVDAVEALVRVVETKRDALMAQHVAQRALAVLKYKTRPRHF